MNAAHLHLLVNHLPVFAGLFGGVFLVVGLLAKQRLLSDAGLVLAVVAALGAFAAMQTGERAEDLVEDQVAVSEATIHEHEEAAEIATWGAVVTGLLALTALLVPSRMAGLKRGVTLGTLVLALGAFGLVARAANLGGQIRHPEIAGGTTVPVQGDEEGDEHPTSPAGSIGVRR